MHSLCFLVQVNKAAPPAHIDDGIELRQLDEYEKESDLRTDIRKAIVVLMNAKLGTKHKYASEVHLEYPDYHPFAGDTLACLSTARK
jgi:hypothetical protein